MKINLESNFNLKEEDFETQSATLGGLFKELSNKYGLTNPEFCDWAVFINGKLYQTFTDGLNIKLKDGDKVEMYLLPLGGG
jgi:molybdopterin converting factor small subunit